MPRNVNVENAVELILERLDILINGGALGRPASPHLQAIFSTHVMPGGGSARLASVFLTSYSITELTWDYKSVPIGIRGQHGDKRLAGALTDRHVTLHKNITAFGENLGWKGNVRSFDLSTDPRFSAYLAALAALSTAEREILLNHAIWQMCSSRVVPQALPPLPATYLSYARCLDLCEKILAIQSEGHVQQFLVAAFLEIHRKRYGHSTVTHHPHASDTFDGTTGDIEEFRDGVLVAAYEVTVRDDWKNRLADFGKKAKKGNLSKYILIASNVRSDKNLHPAHSLMNFVGHLHFDLAVIDITDFFTVFCAELRRDELAEAFNRTYEFLSDRKLCGRADIQESFKNVTDQWLQVPS
ncbi:hypothetical protein [Pseudomonas sp. PMCC200344]|uniref:hypothetical protein n=1 Tax=Pseudomonas sp. PMCC200344 TaxID=3042028 RepID=UPI0024B35678|nr:hypothetical protein [Pseudomonas sp. PMCC200344]